jgi:hypothetical protein
LLAGLAWLGGWGLHALVAGNRSPTPTRSNIPTVTPSPSAPPQPTTTATVASPQGPDRATSTAAPTTIPTPQKNSITVRRNEGLYEVCRRHCPGRFKGPEGAQILYDYARRVADHNGLPWGWRGPDLEPGQELDMPPCP